jgi:hypothetical protein
MRWVPTGRNGDGGRDDFAGFSPRQQRIGTRGNLTRSQRVRLFLNVVVAHDTMIAAALK